MKKVIKPNVYIKVFKITDSNGEGISKNDFELFKEKFKEKQNLYYNEDLNDFCFDSFTQIIREIKRTAHNAGLTVKLIKVEFESFKNYIKVYDSNYLKDINLIISISKIYDSKNKDIKFTVTKIEAYSMFSDTDSVIIFVPIDEDMKDHSNITYIYKQHEMKFNSIL